MKLNNSVKKIAKLNRITNSGNASDDNLLFNNQLLKAYYSGNFYELPTTLQNQIL